MTRVASIQKRRSGKWRARFTPPGGREVARHFPRKVDAQRWIDEQTAASVTGQYVSPAAGRVTFREFAEAWRMSQIHRPSTMARTETNLRRHVYPFFGHREIASILPSEIQTWVKRLSTESRTRKGTPLAPSTIVNIHGQVSGIFKAALRDRRRVDNPCETIRFPRIRKDEIIPLETWEIHALEDSADPRWRASVTLGAGTGMRNGEILGLTVDRIDFLRRTVRIDRQLVEIAGSGPEFGPPKTPASERTIPLPRVVVEALAAHLAEFPPGEHGLVFPDKDGSPMRRTAFSRDVWVPMRTAAGLPDRVTSHDLRHYYASLLIRHGESVKTVQKRLGHASAAETLDTYSHLWPDSDDRTRDAVDGVLGAPADSPRTAEGGDR